MNRPHFPSRRLYLTLSTCVLASVVVSGMPASPAQADRVLIPGGRPVDAKAAAAKRNAMKTQLMQSVAKWKKVREQCGGNYQYTVRFQSWVGFGYETTIVVKANKVVERRYRGFNRNRPKVAPRIGPALPRPNKAGDQPVPVGPKTPKQGKRWIEKGKDIGKHKQGAPPRTLDELYVLAEKTLNAKVDPGSVRFYIRFDKLGLLQNCFYVDTRIADDAPRNGVIINSLTIELPKGGKGEKEGKPNIPAGSLKDADQTREAKATRALNAAKALFEKDEAEGFEALEKLPLRHRDTRAAAEAAEVVDAIKQDAKRYRRIQNARNERDARKELAICKQYIAINKPELAYKALRELVTDYRQTSVAKEASQLRDRLRQQLNP